MAGVGVLGYASFQHVEHGLTDGRIHHLHHTSHHAACLNREEEEEGGGGGGEEEANTNHVLSLLL